jgi:alpha-N-arabinofuranosidase
MKINFLSLLFGFGITFAAAAQTVITVTVNKNVRGTIINKNIYSHFAEHLGKGIYGGFYVGDTSKIPNTNGVRNDVIAALKKMKIPSLRWPGGCFADTYHSKDGIGPKDKRPSIVNSWWGGVVEDNSFGTHDFLNMCELLGAEPYLAGNIGSGTVQELADWVQYVNSDSKNPMSDLRKLNGRQKPWNVKFWGVGNEAWGCGGNMTADYYYNEFKKYSTFMVGSGNINRIASGASDDDYKWTETIMKNVPKGLIEGVALHHYAVIAWDKKGPSTTFTEAQYFETMQRALLMDTLITKHSAIMDRYDPAKKIALIVDEWGGWYDVEPGTNPGFLYQQNTMRDAMIAGTTLNTFNNHADRVRMANLAQCINVLQSVIITNQQKMLLTPTYHVMEMYSVHQNATLLPVKIATGNYTVGAEKLPMISASASRDKDGIIHVSAVNIDPDHSQKVTIDIGDVKIVSVNGRMLASKRIQDYNSFNDPEKIKPQNFKADAKVNTIVVNLPPASVVVLAVVVK